MPKPPPKPLMTVTLNPAMDRTVEVDELRLGEVVRGRLLLLEPAGKGVNAAGTLAALGAEVLAHGFVGRGEAQTFRRAFQGTNVKTEFVAVDGATRQSVTILDRARNQETHITEEGFPLSKANARALLAKAAKAAEGAAWASVNGRPAPGYSVEDYARLVSVLKEHGACVLADTSGEHLAAAVEAGADAIKPNAEELAELVGRQLESDEAIVHAARETARRVRYVVVSLGARGAVCVSRRGVWFAREQVAAEVVHTVGCGDALAMGFMFAMARGDGPAQALRLAVACGGACVRTARASLRQRSEAEAVLPTVALEKWAG